MEWGAKVDAKDYKKNTSLHHAAAYNNVEKAYWLIKYNANINARNKDGNTPLHAACKQGNFKMVKFLINNGALVNVRNKFLYTALHYACEKPTDGLVYYLLKNGAHPYAINIFGQTPLMRAIRFCYIGDIALLIDLHELNFNNPYFLESCPDDETKLFVLERMRFHVCRNFRKHLSQEFQAIAGDKRSYVSISIGLVKPSRKQSYHDAPKRFLRKFNI